MEVTARKRVGSLVEMRAGHFGTSQERAKGQRTLDFNSFLPDVVSNVSACLEVIPGKPGGCESRENQDRDELPGSCFTFDEIFLYLALMPNDEFLKIKEKHLQPMAV
jgi:hypothetical protein